ncbi:MAG: hypothetical protein ACREKL_00080 [Chthoniobacterales bacterium]
MSALIPQILRRTAQITAVLALGLLASCATKKGGSTPPPAASAQKKKEKEKEKKPKPAPTPSPKATPAPEPTPVARYFAKVSVEGGESTQQEITPDNTPAPSPTPSESTEPSASPTPTPSPGPTPKPSNFISQTWQKIFPPKPASSSNSSKPNFITQTWQKIFPPKPTPTPAPGETGRIPASVTTDDGQRVEKVLSEGEGPAAGPTPAPVEIKARPKENILSRTWHMVFPKKEEPPVATLPQWIGTIKLVNERDGYALIDSQQGYYAMPDGEILNSVGGGSESGVLRVTSDRNPPFFIADIVGGKPRAGDRVYSPKP